MQLHADSFEIQAANLFNGNEVGILFSTFNCTSQAVRQQLASGILHPHDFNPTEIYLLQKVGSLRPSLPSYGSS